MVNVGLLYHFLCFTYYACKAPKINAVQCKHLYDALLGLSDVIFEVITSTTRVSPEDLPNLWNEIYRAAKEAQIYLHHCSRDEWAMKFLTRSTTGEAYSLHLHDLALSRLLLDVIHITDTGEISRIFNHFYEEMEKFMKIRHEYADEMQLIKTCEQFAELSTHNTEGQNILKLLKFLDRKLKGIIPVPVSTAVDSVGADTPVPTWLEIDPADLVLERESGAIGEGSFGHVYEGLWLGVRVAAKEMPRDANDVFESEASILAKLHSPFIVHLIGTCVKDFHLYLVMELVSSNLEQILEDRSEGGRPPFSLPVAVDIMLQISRAMEYLHSQEIMHLDLKASNVLFELSSVPDSREEGYGRVKLCDFGTASPRLFSFRASDPKGTCYWRAPEVFPLPYEDMSAETTTPETYTSKADVYSFAMTCYEILTGKQPFAGVLPRELHTRIVNGERPTLEPYICPFILANYIQQCWHTNPDHRPCFEAISHFFRKLKLCLLNSHVDWKEALNNRFYPDFGFLDGEKKSIFWDKLEKWKNEELVRMHSRLDEMLFVWRFLTLEMRRGIAIDIANFLARIHGKPAKLFVYLHLDSSTIYLDWKLKPIFDGVASGLPLILRDQTRKQAKLFQIFMNIQALGKVLIELSTGCTWKDVSIASIQRWIEFSQLEFVDPQLVEEMGKTGERQLWEVVRWCKLGLWCLSESPSKQPKIYTVLQFLKEGAPSGDSSLRDYLSSIPAIDKAYPYSDQQALTLMPSRKPPCSCLNVVASGSLRGWTDFIGVSEEDVSDGFLEDGFGLDKLFGEA